VQDPGCPAGCVFDIDQVDRGKCRHSAPPSAVTYRIPIHTKVETKSWVRRNDITSLVYDKDPAEQHDLSSLLPQVRANELALSDGLSIVDQRLAND
jgi:hypothetical protein